MGIVDFLQRHMFTCPSRAVLRIECPGCGIQRSILCLFRGDISGSLHMHPAAMPFMALVIFLPLHLLFRFRYGAKIIINLQLSIAIITAVFYIYKILTHKIFI
jgi:hypothetical protein